MIDEIKKIKIEELSTQINQYNEKLNNLFQRTNETINDLNKLEKLSCSLTQKRNFSFFEKWITKRKAYKEFKENSNRYPEILKKIEGLKEELLIQEEEKSDMSRKIYEIKSKISLIRNSKTLCEIGLTPVDAIKLLEDNGIQPVLSETDKHEFFHPRDYSSKSALIGVHKTKVMPTDNMIRTAKDAKVKIDSSITINGAKYYYSYELSRDTVHMAMNDEVSSHLYGSWNDCKYAILIPFEEIPNEKIGGANEVDTFTKGSIELPESAWILCPKNEVDNAKKLNPKVNVLGYEGENVLGFSKPFLTQLGYRGEKVLNTHWFDKDSQKQFVELVTREGLSHSLHDSTYFRENELLLTDINEVISLCKLLKEKHLITNSEDMESVVSQWRSQKQFEEKGLAWRATKECDEPEAITRNKREVDVFLEEMEKSGFSISPKFQHDLIELKRSDNVPDYRNYVNLLIAASCDAVLNSQGEEDLKAETSEKSFR